MALQEAVSRISPDPSHDSHRSLDTSPTPHSISIRRPDFSILQFVSSRGNEYYCEIDEDYLTDRFNLTGLNTEVQYYQYALDLVTDVFDMEVDDDMREQIEKSARHLYGLVHARYIVTTRGLAKMVRLIAFLIH
jgi:casein kinase II subunit beta